MCISFPSGVDLQNQLKEIFSDVTSTPKGGFSTHKVGRKIIQIFDRIEQQKSRKLDIHLELSQDNILFVEKCHYGARAA